MRKFVCATTLICLLLITGCGKEGTAASVDLQSQNKVSATTVFVSGMGCSDINCTDLSHHHDCPTDCGDYDHHHYCDLDCTDASHHHSGAGNTNTSGQHHTEQHHAEQHHGDGHH